MKIILFFPDDPVDTGIFCKCVRYLVAAYFRIIPVFEIKFIILSASTIRPRGRTGLMARASDSGSGDPGSILGRVGVFVSLSKRHLLPQKSTGNTQE